MAGVAFEPDPDPDTLTETDALLVPLYVAVMVPLPNGNRKLATCSVAVAVPADPVNAADPSEIPPVANETHPDGVAPLVDVTVAIKYTTSFAATVLRLASSVRFVVGGGGGAVLAPSHPVTSLYMSTDPSPVVRS